jgi:hypothetical protein
MHILTPRFPWEQMWLRFTLYPLRLKASLRQKREMKPGALASTLWSTGTRKNMKALATSKTKKNNVNHQNIPSYRSPKRPQWSKTRRKIPSRRTGCTSMHCTVTPCTVLIYSYSCGPVLRIHDILVWIRIRIRGCMPLINASGFGSCYFRH